MPNYVIVLLLLAVAVVTAITHVYIGRILKLYAEAQTKLKASEAAYHQLANLNDVQHKDYAMHIIQYQSVIAGLRQAVAAKHTLDVLYVWQKPEDIYSPACAIITYAPSVTEARVNAQQGYLDYRRMHAAEPDVAELAYVNTRFFTTPIDTVDLLTVGATVINNVVITEE